MTNLNDAMAAARELFDNNMNTLPKYQPISPSGKDVEVKLGGETRMLSDWLEEMNDAFPESTYEMDEVSMSVLSDRVHPADRIQ